MSHHYDIALSILKKLYEKGYTAFFAGGWVRDYLMDHPSDDIDIVTDASVKEMQKFFPKTIPVGVNFGVVIVVEKGHQFEVATFRKDQGYKDGRRPIGIDKATPKEDAERRDFTINGMFYDPLDEKLYDYVGGQEDIKKGVIRAIGNPHERFLEDRLRMIRAVRYASRFHFLIDNETLKAILDHADSLFPAVAIERVWNEFSKMSTFSNFNRAISTLHRLNLLPVIFPNLKGVSIEEIEKRVENFLHFPEETPLIAKILELFPNTSLREKEILASYLKLSNKNLNFIRYYQRAKEILTSEKEREKYEWANLYADPLYPITLKIIASHFPIEERQTFLQKHHMQYDHLEQAIVRIQNKTPLITSEDLRKVGIENGPKMGELLKIGERIAINEGLEDSREILKRLGFTQN
ncbi:MAG: CCA tRNA nucleotidyltransferase [Simkaniaceae bacterium]|nr:CCA tRNA nucleotidyltransferase [Simkaniaceae bacterium]